MDWDLEPQIIFETIAGSQLYGTSTPDSDFDSRGVCIPPRRVILDPFAGFDQADSFPGQDRTIYGLAKFMKLCADANPNLIELLYSPENCWIRSSKEWRMLLEHRSLFVSKKVRHTFSGYFYAQVKSIKNHKEWISNPPDHKPTREEFGLTDSPVIGKDSMENIVNVNFDYLTENLRDEVRRERQYRAAKILWDNYEAWEKNRNPKRKELEKAFLYDTKSALHALRLMMEGTELMLTGNITFPLPQAEYLLQVRNGLLTYEQLMEIVDRVDSDFAAMEAHSTLPYGPDIKGIKKLYFEMIEGWD